MPLGATPLLIAAPWHQLFSLGIQTYGYDLTIAHIQQDRLTAGRSQKSLQQAEMPC